MKTKKRFSKLTAWVLTLAMMMTFIPSITIGVNAADNTTTEKNITLGASALKGGQQSNIYFGRYQQSSLGSEQPTTGTEGNDWINSTTAVLNGQGTYYSIDPIKWRVLSNADGKAFLLSDKNLDVVRYHEDFENVTWETSTIRSWLNGYDATSNQNSVDYSNDNFINAAFGAAEKGVIADTTVMNDDNPTFNTEGGNNTTDKVFLLSIAEAHNTSYFANDNSRKSVNTAYVYGGGKNGTRDMYGVGEADYWWLRSPGSSSKYAAIVHYHGEYINGMVNRNNAAVRPAFNINLSSVLFTSAAEDGKQTGFNAVEYYSGNEYKLTLKDSSRSFEVSDTTAKTVITGEKISFIYTGAETGANEYISAMLVDGNNEILYYGTLASVTSDSDTVEIIVPSDIAAGTYTLKLFNEQINGDCKTDYASDFADIALTVEVPAPEPATYTVTFHANNGTDDTDSERVADGSTLTITNNVFTYGKCKIESWNTEADGSGETYSADEVITVSGDVTLYAQWVLPLDSLDAFTDGDLEWSGKASAPYTFTMKNGTKLFASVIFPAQSGDDKTTIIVDGNSEIKGDIAFRSGTGQAGSNFSADLTIKGAGTLQFNGLSSTGSGDTFTVETDVTITSNYMFIGASGGTGSKIVIKNATLTLHDLTLLQHLTMEGEARLEIIDGNASFNADPEISLSDNSVISIGGNGYDSVLYKDGMENNEVFDALIDGGWLPEGCYFVAENYGYYLYDAEGIKIDNITIGKQTAVVPPPGSVSGSGGASRCTVKFETNGGSIIANKRVIRNNKLVEPEVPTKDGYTFDGWYTDEELTEKYNFDSNVRKDFTLYAKWVKVEDETDKPDENDKPGHDCPSLKFGDLDISQWYHLDTDYVIENGFFKGVTETEFAPNDKLTRAMLVTVLYRVEGEPATNRSIPFADVDMGAYYANAVIWAKQNGIIKGYSETEFGPNDNITREQIAVIMHRYATFKGYDVSVGENTNILSYDDFAQISEYAISSMQWAVGSGLINGKSESTLEPKNFATRAEIAAILHRFIEANK